MSNLDSPNSFPSALESEVRPQWMLLIMRLVLAAVFATAATFKFYGFVMYGNLAELPPWMFVSLLTAEFAFTWWLLTARAAWAALLWTVGTGVLMLAIAYHIGGVITGSVSCNCFGEYSPSHKAMVVLLTLVLSGWVWGRPSGMAGIGEQVYRLRSDANCMGTLLGLAIFTAMAVATYYGIGFTPIVSPRDGVIAIQPSIKEVGLVAAEHSTNVKIEVLNRSDSPAKLIGGGTSCGCVTLQQFPCEIAPRSSMTFEIQYTPTAGDLGKSIEKRFRYFIDHPTQRFADGVLKAQVVAANEMVKTSGN